MDGDKWSASSWIYNKVLIEPFSVKITWTTKSYHRLLNSVVQILTYYFKETRLHLKQDIFEFGKLNNETRLFFDSQSIRGSGGASAGFFLYENEADLLLTIRSCIDLVESD